uniref:Uncharacterized protein n=1 Tax=Ditylenchus dipsaci TaxID=166011 RepID=A0A915D8I7_9BILA
MPINFLSLFLTVALLSTFLALIVFVLASVFLCRWSSGSAGNSVGASMARKVSLGRKDHLRFDNDKDYEEEDQKKSYVEFENIFIGDQAPSRTTSGNEVPKIVITSASLKSRPF